ncbi:MAG TPA: hypothetical protein PLO37_13475 [Candidatus Hydrogenedentes bacterium]|nr:hypothetical protein [Candidatus Hydrogenedentota bacterium]
MDGMDVVDTADTKEFHPTLCTRFVLFVLAALLVLAPEVTSGVVWPGPATFISDFVAVRAEL